jgi:hypothetical protein
VLGAEGGFLLQGELSTVMQSMSSSMDPSRQEPASIGGGAKSARAGGGLDHVCMQRPRACAGRGSRGDRVVAPAVEGGAAIRTGLAVGRDAARRCLVSGSALCGGAVVAVMPWLFISELTSFESRVT